MSNNNTAKQQDGEYAATLIKDNITVGIGTGSTVYFFIHALAKRVAEGLKIQGVTTSKQSEKLATELGIPLIDFNEANGIAITIDGADEVDENLQLIKGGGGALLQEKMVAAASKKLIIIADESKLVKTLGHFPLPVEVIQFGWKQTIKHIAALGCKEIVLRKKEETVFISDHGHYILDCHFEAIDNATMLNEKLNNIPGVVENGLFIGMADSALIAYNDGTVKTVGR